MCCGEFTPMKWDTSSFYTQIVNVAGRRSLWSISLYPELRTNYRNGLYTNAIWMTHTQKHNLSVILNIEIWFPQEERAVKLDGLIRPMKPTSWNNIKGVSTTKLYRRLYPSSEWDRICEKLRHWTLVDAVMNALVSIYNSVYHVNFRLDCVRTIIYCFFTPVITAFISLITCSHTHTLLFHLLCDMQHCQP